MCVFQLNTVRELVSNYDLDGLNLDFVCMASFLDVGHQWGKGDELAQWVCSVRQMILQVRPKRGHS